MQALLLELRYAFRALRKRPGLTAGITLVLGLGIGAVVTVFSVVDTFIFRDLPYPDADRLVWIQSRHGENVLGVSHADYLDWNDESVFAGMAQFNAQNHSVVTFKDGAESLQATRVTSSIFSVLGARPYRGRLFDTREDEPNSGNVLLLSYGLWRRRYGEDESAIGESVKVDGQPFTVAGVMPPGFDFPTRTDVWLPNSSWADQWPFRNIRVDSVLGRLKKDVSLEQARTALEEICRSLETQYSDTNSGIRPHLLPVRDVWIQNSRRGLLLLLGACGFLLLIACANVANLLLVWADVRGKDLAVRTALGAPASRLIRQPMLESLLLGLLGGACGLLLSFLGVRLTVELIPIRLPLWVGIQVDSRVLLFAVLISSALGLLFGLAPGFRALRVNAFQVLRQGADPSGARGGMRLRRGLVLTEVAVALMLVIGAGLLSKSFAHLQNTDTGFGSNILTFQIDVPVFSLQSYDQVRNYYREILERTGSLGGVEAVGATTSMPLARKGTWDLWDFTLEHQGPEEQKSNPRVYGQGVSDDYFQAMEIPLLQGRVFRRDDDSSAPPGVLVSRSFAQRFWPNGGDAVGKRLKLGGPETKSPFMEIVGVVGEVRFEGLDRSANLGLYMPLDRLVSWPLYVAVKASGDPTRLVSQIRSEVGQVSADLGVRDVALIDQHVSDSLWKERLWSVLFVVLSALALLLSAAGVYGIVSYMVNRRRHEIGIRLALGASRIDVAKTVVGESLRLTVFGVVLGLAGSLALSRLLESLLSEVKSNDPTVFAASSAIIGAVALVAAWGPLRRAVRVDPSVVLKYE